MSKVTREEIVTFLHTKIKETAEQELKGAEVNNDSDIQEEYGYDSLDAVELIMECEKTYNVAIPDDAGAELVTVNKIADYIVAELGKKTNA